MSDKWDYILMGAAFAVSTLVGATIGLALGFNVYASELDDCKIRYNVNKCELVAIPLNGQPKEK